MTEGEERYLLAYLLDDSSLLSNMEPRRVVPLRRRTFLQSTAIASAAWVVTCQDQGSAKETAPPSDSPPVIDTNVYLSQWPFRRLPQQTTATLVEYLKKRHVVQAWAGSFDGLLHRDVASVNAWLAEQCRQAGDDFLIPFGTVNPRLADWQEDLRQLDEQHRMPGIRLHPNYHGYSLSDPVCRELLGRARDRELIVQVVPWMEDERHQHPLMPVPEEDLTPLAEVASEFPDLRLMILNGFRAAGGRALSALAEQDSVHFDFAKLDVIDGLSEFLEKVPAERLLFGSYSPMFYFESARLKPEESALSPELTRTLLSGNAQRLLNAHAGGGGASS